MANRLKTMIQIRRILQLLTQGKTVGQIAKELSMALNTVKKYCKNFEKSGLNHEQIFNLEDASLQLIAFPQRNALTNTTDSRQKHLQGLLPEFIQRLQTTHITRELLWQEYRKTNPQGYGYSQFCDYLQKHLLIQKATFHLVHKPGETLQIDFAGDKLSYTDPQTGEIIYCPVLVCTMPFSSFSYIEALPSASQENLIASLNNCLAYLGGVPYNIKSDNLKQIVNKPNRYEPVFSEIIDQFALYYNVSFTATRVAKPKDKASVERHVGIAYQKIYSIAEQQNYYSITELNTAIKSLLNNLNQATMQKKEYSRQQLFEEMEKPLLNKLPEQPFIPKHQTTAKVGRNYHVILGEDWHHYSVPAKYIGKKVDIIYSREVVEIYYNQERIALHAREYKKHQYTTIKEHMPENHRAAKEMGGYTVEYFLAQAFLIGENTHKVIEHITQSRFFTEQSFNACLGIIRLKNKYNTQRIENACRTALKGYKINYRTIVNILENNRDLLLPSDNSQPNSTPAKKHSNIRGKENYTQLLQAENKQLQITLFNN